MEWHFYAEVIPCIPLANITLLDIIMCSLKQGRPKVTCFKNLLASKLVNWVPLSSSFFLTRLSGASEGNKIMPSMWTLVGPNKANSCRS